MVRHVTDHLRCPTLQPPIVNCRVLPEGSIEFVQSTFEKVFANNQVTLKIATEVTRGPASPLRPDIMRTITRITDTLWPGVAVIPTMVPGATDGRFLRAAGIPSYGGQGLFLDQSDIRMHGRDERISVKSFYEGQTFLYELVKTLSIAGE